MKQCWEVHNLKVKVMKKLYQMSNKEYVRLLEVASEQVPFGIYALEKTGYAELLNIHCSSKTELKARKRAFKQQGFRVLCNGV